MISTSPFKQHGGILSPFVDGWRSRKIASAIAPGESILDVGCGPGLLIPHLPKDCRYTGVDRARDVIAYNSEHFKSCSFVCLDVLSEKLPADQQFDVVVLGAFLEHFQDPRPVLAEIRKVLKPAGRIVATTPSPLGGMVHEVLAHIGLLSHDAAEEHEGFLTRSKITKISQQSKLKLTHYETFQMGLNQFFIITVDD